MSIRILIILSFFATLGLALADSSLLRLICGVWIAGAAIAHIWWWVHVDFSPESVVIPALPAITGSVAWDLRRRYGPW
jgi:Na+/proline symporter